MGSWLKTCGLSNLHIHAGSQVLVFVLEKNTSETDRSYSTSFWRPVLVPFYSVYDDYGGGENSHGIGLDLVLDGLRKYALPVPQGENTYHDIPVNPAELDEAKFFEAVRKGRLSVRGGTNGAMIDYTMFRMDVVNHICENFRQEFYVGSGKGTTGFENCYVSFTYKNVLDSVPEFIYLFSEIISKSVCDYNSLISMIGSSDVRNPAAMYLGEIYSHRFSYICRPAEALGEYITARETEKAEQLVKDMVLGSFLESFMGLTRKVWMPGGHEGSQSVEHEAYLALCNAINSAISSEKDDNE